MADKLGRTAMFYAVLYNQEDILEYFIEKQANCNVMSVYNSLNFHQSKNKIENNFLVLRLKGLFFLLGIFKIYFSCN